MFDDEWWQDSANQSADGIGRIQKDNEYNSLDRVLAGDVIKMAVDVVLTIAVVPW